MATIDLDVETAMTALETLEELIARQRARVLAAARRVRPGLTDGDLGNVNAFPDVLQDLAFQVEDRRLAGLRAARIAVQARLAGSTVAQG